MRRTRSAAMALLSAMAMTIAVAVPGHSLAWSRWGCGKWSSSTIYLTNSSGSYGTSAVSNWNAKLDGLNLAWGSPTQNPIAFNVTSGYYGNGIWKGKVDNPNGSNCPGAVNGSFVAGQMRVRINLDEVGTTGDDRVAVTNHELGHALDLYHFASTSPCASPGGTLAKPVAVMYAGSLKWSNAYSACDTLTPTSDDNAGVDNIYP